MTPETKRRIDRLLEVVSELTGPEREARLAEADPRIAAEVRNLLSLLPEADQLFAPLLEPVREGSTVGAWRLREVIGRGGMGVVWRAERADGEYSGVAAIKVLAVTPGGASWRRFQQEKQILAALQHPGIARLLDAGATESGIPWLAMEIVDGRNIVEFAKDLDLRRRVLLFVELCRIVEYAHQRLIVHRDLKPSNILVQEDGQVKLLDFGIALDLDAQEDRLTGPWSQMLSPEWASPEQVRGERAITTASDVFSLGRVLAAVLTGTSGLEGLAGAKLLQTVLQADLPLPSRVSGDHRLKGDLDSIVLKATAARSQDRYASVAELRQDLENWVELRPVRARAWTIGYRARRFLQRNWIGLVAASLMAFVVTGAFLAVRNQADRAIRERDRAEAALREASEARSAALRGEAEAMAAQQEAERAREDAEKRKRQVEQAVSVARRRFADAWKLSRQLIFDYQKSLDKIGAASELRARMVEDSISLLDKLDAADTPPAFELDLALAYQELAGATGIQGRNNAGNTNRAKHALEQSEKLLRGLLARDPSNRAVRRHLANVLALEIDTGKPEGAAEALRLLETLEAEDPGDREVLWSLGNLHFWASVRKPVGEPRILGLERSLSYFEKLLSLEPDSPDRMQAAALLHKQVSSTYYAISNAEKTCAHASEALRLDRQRLDRDPASVRIRFDLTISQGVWADCVYLREGYAGLAGVLESMIETRREILRADPENAFYRDRLAHALFRMGNMHLWLANPEAALPWFTEGLATGATALRADLLFGRTVGLARLQRTGEACEALAEGLKLAPTLAGTLANWAEDRDIARLRESCQNGGR
jgi:serine/threonine-protein kinase